MPKPPHPRRFTFTYTTLGVNTIPVDLPGNCKERNWLRVIARSGIDRGPFNRKYMKILNIWRSNGNNYVKHCINILYK